MRHVILTCKHHPHLRWSCKDIAFSGDGLGYNGSRNIRFCGEPTGAGMHHDLSGLDCTTFFPDRGDHAFVHECSCPPSDLIRAPEDALVKGAA